MLHSFNMSLTRIDSAIRYSFYFLVAIVPLIMWRSTSELFELNKMWAVWGTSLFILALWVSKMFLTKKIIFKRTPLDIPIALFLFSQLISTLFSMDPYVSFWGYYSRFNGGFLSILSYIFLYYAFAANLLDEQRRNTFKVITAMFIGGTIVALWGFPSHFGYDPTCLMFRGTLDVSCWTEAFQPKVRIFSTLGQPNWLAAYLAILIPLGIAFLLNQLSSKEKSKTQSKFSLLNFQLSKQSIILSALYLILTIIFYIDLTWTDSQSGFLGLWIGLVVFILTLGFLTFKSKKIKIWKNKLIVTGAIISVFLLLSVMLGTPVERLRQFTFPTSSPVEEQAQDSSLDQPEQPALPALEFGGTDSSKIRLIVWQGAIDIFKENPIIGSGVETFAYAYYKHRPAEHNLTSEWDYLYNKAHNEYLNYLATTGIFGLGTYLLFIGWVIILFVKNILKSVKNNEVKTTNLLFATALFSGWISILVSNFFGFSVVITNLFLFLIPIWILLLVHEQFYPLNDKTISTTHLKTFHQSAYRESISPTTVQKLQIVSITVVVLVLAIVLWRYWSADKAYGLGKNLNSVGDYVTANQYLIEAVQKRPREDIFKDELAVNVSTLALLYQQQNESTQAAQFAQQAMFLSDSVVSRHPNNVVFWKSRTRIMYSLAQIDPSFYQLSIEAIERAHELAPTDAKVLYNKALLYDQGGLREQAVEVLGNAIELKPNYRDAFYAKALIHSEIADSIEASNSAQALQERELARDHLNFILDNISPEDTQANELLEKLN